MAIFSFKMTKATKNDSFLREKPQKGIKQKQEEGLANKLKRILKDGWGNSAINKETAAKTQQHCRHSAINSGFAIKLIARN